jgi:hypothetical protein
MTPPLTDYRYRYYSSGMRGQYRVRVPDELWLLIREAAEREGISANAWVLAAVAVKLTLAEVELTDRQVTPRFKEGMK